MEIKHSNPKNKYDIIARIGSGTFGDVFKATHLLTGKIYALKSIKIEKDEDFNQIKNEINAINLCKHRNVVNVFEAFLSRSRLWMCMEICDGGSLQDILSTVGPLPELIIAYVIREAVTGLQYVHSVDRIHRDIKGGNILLNSHGEIKIADFGIAANLTKTFAKRCSILGTPYWMAPEVISPQKTGGYGKSCDIWSIGITTIELADTEPPLYDLHPMAALHAISKSSYKSPTVRDPSKWSAEMTNFIKKTLIKNVRYRLTASECLNHVFLKNDSLSPQHGVALYKSKMAKIKRTEESCDTLVNLENEIDNFPPDSTLNFDQKEDTLNNSEGLTEEAEEDYPSDNGLCYTWDWRKQVKQLESIGIPRIECVLMGSGLTKICEECDLGQILSTELWIDNTTLEQNILLGTSDGLFMAGLKILGEFVPKKVFYKPCTWLHVNMYETVVALCSSVNESYLYCLDMVELCRNGLEVNRSPKLSEIFGLKNRRGSVYQKLADTKDILRCAAYRSSVNCEDYLLCTLPVEVVLLQWYLNPRKYLLIKRIAVSIPRGIQATYEPLLGFDNVYPYLCFGVSGDLDKFASDKSSVEYDYVDLNYHTGWGVFQDHSSDVKCNTLQAIFIGQLSNETVLVGFRDWAGVYDLEGFLSDSIIMTFDVKVESYVIISNGLLAVHRHGVIGKNYQNEIIQNIDDPSRAFTLLGSKGFMVLQTVDEWGVTDLHVLTGYETMP